MEIKIKDGCLVIDMHELVRVMTDEQRNELTQHCAFDEYLCQAIAAFAAGEVIWEGWWSGGADTGMMSKLQQTIIAMRPDIFKAAAFGMLKEVEMLKAEVGIINTAYYTLRDAKNDRERYNAMPPRMLTREEWDAVRDAACKAVDEINGRIRAVTAPDSGIVEALTIEPCHTTGMHDPTHTPRYICESQMAEAYKRTLEVLGMDEPPRRLHDDCYWCNGNDSGENNEDCKNNMVALRRWVEEGWKPKDA